MPTRKNFLLSTVVAAFGALAVISAAQGQSPAASRAAVPPGFTSHIADLGEVKIHYVIGGNGPPVLLLHGWPETWYEWRKVMPLLAQGHTVIAADLRGMGDSSLAPSGYDKKTLAQDMRQLMVKLGHPVATLVGHDWGGPVAYAYAAQYRDGVDKLVLIEGSPFGPWMKSTNILWFFDFLRKPGYAEKLITGREREFLRDFYDNPEMHVVPAFDKGVIDIYSTAYSRPGRMGPSYGLYRSIDQDVRDNGEFARTKLTIPVLAIGAEAGAGPLVFEASKQVAASPSTLLFHKTGHFIPEERPEPLARAVLDFMAGKPVPQEWIP